MAPAFRGITRRPLWQIVAALVCLALSGGVASANESQRLALVIGNSTYAEAPLKNPANDARAMAKSLRERGFEVLLRENATKKDMETAVADFGEKLTEGATGLFFFAGHGMQVNGRNFLIPVDAKISSEQRVRLETLDVDVVLDQMSAAHAKVSMMILDACRNNPFERRFRSVGGGLAQINAPEGTLISYATAPGKVAADGDGANGLYTQELLKALSQPGLKVEDVFKQVRVNVSRVSNGAQIPWEASSLTGDFYFLPPRPVATAPDTSPLIEMAFWDAVKGSTNPAEFSAYLQKYPNGNFSPLAQARLAALSAPPVATPVSAPAAAVAPGPAKPVPAAPPQQVASLPPATAVTGNFDGRYTTSFRGATSRGTATYNATIEIQGTQIAGFVQSANVSGGIVTGPGTGFCRLIGAIDIDGKLQRLQSNCFNISASFTGRFAYDGTGKVFGDTKTTAASGESSDARWVEDGPPPASRSIALRRAATGPFDGWYRSEFRLAGFDIQANLEIAGQQVSGSGFAHRPGNGQGASGSGPCRISGTIDATGGVQRIDMKCPDVDVSLTGKFAADPQTGKLAGNTKGKSPVYGSTDVHWAQN